MLSTARAIDQETGEVFIQFIIHRFPELRMQDMLLAQTRTLHLSHGIGPQAHVGRGREQIVKLLLAGVLPYEREPPGLARRVRPQHDRRPRMLEVDVAFFHRKRTDRAAKGAAGLLFDLFTDALSKPGLSVGTEQ